jgi:hypothetical protein
MIQSNILVQFLFTKGRGALLIVWLAFVCLSYTSSFINIVKVSELLNINSFTKEALFTCFSLPYFRNILVYNWLSSAYVTICALPMILCVFCELPSTKLLLNIQFGVCHTIRCILFFASTAYGKYYYADYAIVCEQIAVSLGFMLSVALAYRYFCVSRSA